MTDRRRFRLSLRARLAMLCLGLSVLSGGLLMVGMNLLITSELVNRYTSPPLVIDLCSSHPTERFLADRRAANDQADQIAREIRLASLAGFGVLIALAGVACWYVSGRALRPVRQITLVASRLSQDTLNERIAYAGARDELQTLVDSFNAMLDRLNRAFEGQRLFVANASHELRTPLTVVRTAADIALAKPSRPEADYRKTLSTIDQAAQRSENLLDSLLRLARTQHRKICREPVDLSALAASAGQDLSDTIQVRRELSPATIIADSYLIELLLRNLIDNALRYNVPEGWIALRTNVEDRHAILEVENTGVQIKPAETCVLLQPFRRGEASRSVKSASGGFGLGLAIVDAIVHAHDGQLDITPRVAGGLLIRITLPIPLPSTT